MTELSDLDDGLDSRGRIRREGELSRIAPPFRPLVGDVEDALRKEFGPRLHSLYLYGSVPRGTAVEGVSDLDVSVVLHDDVTADDRARAAAIGADLDRLTDLVDGVGILVDPQALFRAPDERHDGAFHISCLCTPLWGRDLAAELPEHRPTIELAQGLGRGVETALATLTSALERGSAGARRKAGRRLARLAFASVLARWPGWSSEPDTMAAVITAFHPDRTDDVARCLRLGWSYRYPPSDELSDADALDLLRTSGPWWLAEHRRATGHAIG